MTEEDKKTYNASIKSQDTEEFLDLWFYRPLGFRCALFFRNRGIHPNTITILSIFLGIAAGICFYQESLRWNILGTLLLMWANLYDSTDGQLARITGQKTRWGRILDGFAGDCWFFCIYFAIAARETFAPIPFAPEHQWGALIWILCGFCGFWVHGSQCQLADYYRNIHLYFINEENGNEFHDSAAQRKEYAATPWRGNFFWKIFLNAYVAYVENQERMTPCFQKFIATARSHYGTAIPRNIREEFRKGSLPLMKYTNILTFNSRAIMLCFTMLTGKLWLYLFFELVVLMALFIYMRHKHETLCRRLTATIEKQPIENIKGIIFDYGGTIDTNGIHWGELIEEEYRKAETGISKELFREAYVYAERALAKNPIIAPHDTFHTLLEKKITLQAEYLAREKAPITPQQREKIARGCYQKVLDTLAVTRTIVEQLSARYPLVLVTNFYGNMPIVLQEFSLGKYFPNIIESSVVGLRKPDPALFALGVKALNLPPEEVLVIGDSYRKDIQPARTLGCKAVWIKNICWEEEPIQPGAEPTATIASLQELPSLI